MSDPDLTPGPLGPCEPYCQIADLCGDDFDGDVALAADCIIDASEILYALLGRQLHGQCTATVETDSDCSWWTDGRAVLGYSWWQSGSTRLGYVPRNVITLDGPVVSIASVSIGGEALDPALYVLVDGNKLMRADRDDWSGVVQVAYTFGVPIPRYARDACVELAGELQKERCGGASCLPLHTTSVSRQGLNLNLDRDVERVREAGPALPKVMVAMSVINPTGQRWPAQVYSPDDPHPLHAVRTFEAP